jgi:hypothetical protein
MAKKWLSGNRGRIIAGPIERAQARNRWTEKAPSRFFVRTPGVISTPWTLAANADVADPRTKGERPRDLEEETQYFVALEALSVKDVKVQILVTEVLNLVRPLADLLTEPLRSRVTNSLRKPATRDV